MKKLRTKEKIGLHPVMSFIIMSFVVIVLSGVLRFFNVQSTFNKVSSVTGDFQVTSEAIKSLFNLSGVKYIFTTTVSNFANFALLSNLIIILLGIGIMVKSGFLKTVTTLLTKRAKKTTVTFWLILICILANIMGDLSYIIFVPLGALLFENGKRNPMIGIIASFAGLICGSGLSLFITSIDSSLINMTVNNANMLPGTYSISQFGFIFAMPILIIVLAIVLTRVTEGYIAKRVPKYEFEEEDLEEDLVMTKKKSRGLLYALFASLIYLIIFIYNIIPGLPLSGNLLDYSQTLYIDKLFSYNSFVSNGFVFIITVLFIILGLFYGIGAKTINNNKEFVDGLCYSLNGIGKILVMIFAASTFINIFKYTNIGNVIAGYVTGLITNSGFRGIPLLLLLFVGAGFVSIFQPNTLSSWSIMSGVIPTTMNAGISPAFAQLVFRLGSSFAIALTPIFSYFIVYLAFLANYNKSSKPITIKNAVKYQLPYVIVTAVMFITFIIISFLINFPIGIGTSAAI